MKGPFAITVSNALRHEEVLRLKALLDDDNRYLRDERLQASGEELVGEASGLAEVMGLVRQVALSSSPVLLLGETGVGKEVVANAVHRLSPRSQGPLIKVNCGAIPETLDFRSRRRLLPAPSKHCGPTPGPATCESSRTSWNGR